MGARKLAIINVWLLGCVPAVRELSPAGACSDTLNQLAAGFNDALRSLLADGGLAPRLPGLVYSLGDAFGFTRDAGVHRRRRRVLRGRRAAGRAGAVHA